MILAFTNKINGTPSLFAEKILAGLLKELETNDDWNFLDVPDFIYEYGQHVGFNTVDDAYEVIEKQIPKIHSFRKDIEDLWKTGVEIEFAIEETNNSKYQFAQRIPVISTQKVSIKYHTNTIVVHIDSKLFYFGGTDHVENEFENYRGMLELAQNDGFDTLEDFFDYFNEDFTGKIIHWTDKKY